MILGSHNSWSYMPARRWWMKPLAFAARCQDVGIRRQYALGVRCFDLRVRFNRRGLGIVAHGMVEYCFTASKIYEDLSWLDSRGDCMVRVLLEVRSSRRYNKRNVTLFRQFCSRIEDSYTNIRFWCGRNLYNWAYDYDFFDYPSCGEMYASVCSPKVVDDWWPWLFARFHNREIRRVGTEKDVLLMDFVDIR